MATLRELLPYLIGGAAGALGGPQAARGIQSAAAWSHKLREDELANERRDRIEAQTARRLEMAEAAEKRQEEAHRQRIDVTALRDKEAREKHDQFLKDQRDMNSAREIMGQRLEAIGYDPALAADMTTRQLYALEEEVKKEEKRFEDIRSARQHFVENPLGIGESAQVWTDQGALSVTGPRRKTPTSKVSAGVVDADIEIINAKWDAKIQDAQDEIAEAQADLDNYTEEDPEYKKARRTIAQQEGKILSFDRMREAEIIKKLHASGVSNEKIEEFRNRNQPDPGAPPLEASHVDVGTARGLYETMLQEQQERNPALIRFR